MKRRILLGGELEEIFTISPSSTTVSAQNSNKTYYVTLYINGNPAIGKSASDFTITKSGACSAATFNSSTGQISYYVYGNGGSSSSKSGSMTITYKETTFTHNFYMSADSVTSTTYGSYSNVSINSIGENSYNHDDYYGSITNINWVSNTQVTLTYTNTMTTIRASRSVTKYYSSGYQSTSTTTEYHDVTGSGSITLTTNSDKTSITNISGTFSAYSSKFSQSASTGTHMYNNRAYIYSIGCPTDGDIYFVITNGSLSTKFPNVCAW